MSYRQLLRVLGYIDPTAEPLAAPDYILEYEPRPEPQPETGAEDTCTCRNLVGIGQNPTCPDHPWWARDAIVLNLADHPDGPWTAAAKTFGGSA